MESSNHVGIILCAFRGGPETKIFSFILPFELQEKKQREKTVITKDLQPLLDSLPTVDLIHHEASDVSSIED